jgi:hypothetical protein
MAGEQGLPAELSVKGGAPVRLAMSMEYCTGQLQPQERVRSLQQDQQQLDLARTCLNILSPAWPLSTHAVSGAFEHSNTPIRQPCCGLRVAVGAELPIRLVDSFVIYADEPGQALVPLEELGCGAVPTVLSGRILTPSTASTSGGWGQDDQSNACNLCSHACNVLMELSHGDLLGSIVFASHARAASSLDLCQAPHCYAALCMMCACRWGQCGHWSHCGLVLRLWRETRHLGHDRACLVSSRQPLQPGTCSTRC